MLTQRDREEHGAVREAIRREAPDSRAGIRHHGRLRVLHRRLGTIDGALEELHLHGRAGRPPGHRTHLQPVDGFLALQLERNVHWHRAIRGARGRQRESPADKHHPARIAPEFAALHRARNRIGRDTVEVVQVLHLLAGHHRVHRLAADRDHQLLGQPQLVGALLRRQERRQSVERRAHRSDAGAELLRGTHCPRIAGIEPLHAVDAPIDAAQPAADHGRAGRKQAAESAVQVIDELDDRAVARQLGDHLPGCGFLDHWIPPPARGADWKASTRTSRRGSPPCSMPKVRGCTAAR